MKLQDTPLFGMQSVSRFEFSTHVAFTQHLELGLGFTSILKVQKEKSIVNYVKMINDELPIHLDNICTQSEARESK